MTKPCANHTAKNRECARGATPGHIYCNPCRLTTGGYDRYNAPPAKSGTQHSSNQQE